ncbi:MAG TPA: tetratricopeptide repeat protein [Janthinobacterium sp.]|nr:tetratricopeptide repeat protein [Janthinobacterium sp.]
MIRATLLATAVMFTAPVFAADPTIQQVYAAAEAGKFSEAQAMMDQVLRDHPNSAKAHFAEAELLAKQGRMSNAEAELNTAERLAPGLPFAKPASVQNLKDRIAASHAPARTSSYAPRQVQQIQQAPAPSSGMPWGLLIVALVLIGFIAFAVRFMGRRNTPTYSPGGMGNYGSGPGMQPYSPGGVGPGMGPVGGGGIGGGGIGSGIVGGLATGAAMGAGLVAGEALMHHFTDGNRNNETAYQPPPQQNNGNYVPDDNMGGDDFGINDDSSWDDNSGGGGGGDDSW